MTAGEIFRDDANADLHIYEAAERAVTRYLAAGGSHVIATEPEGQDLYGLFDEIAREGSGFNPDEAELAIEALDQWASDRACDRYLPVFDAICYFGLAMGVRLAGARR
jgi:hypothetical protein